jgi:hypothetical protein
MPPPGWGGIIIGWPMCAAISCTRVANELVKTHEPACHRKPQHHSKAGQPPAGPRDSGCRVGPVRPDAVLQADVARRTARRSQPLVSLDPAVPAMRCGQPCDDAGRPRRQVWLRAYRRQRYQCRGEPSPLGPHPSRPLTIPGPQAGGRATNARRRDGAGQHRRVGETSSDDAGTDVHTAPAA